MEVINYFSSDRQEYLLEQIGKSDWGAALYLRRLIKDGEFHKLLGEKSKLLMLTQGDELISFCTLAERDDIQPTDLTPWIGFVYTFPEKRGQHAVGRLFDEIAKIAKEEGFSQAYISTNHVGLYEKYGCEFYCMMKDIGGEPSRVYIKRFPS